jgi:hypothetical protein
LGRRLFGVTPRGTGLAHIGHTILSFTSGESQCVFQS